MSAWEPTDGSGGLHGTARSALLQVAARLEAIVASVGKVLRPLAISGLVAAAVIALALAPWLFHHRVAVVCWVVVVGVCAGAALRLLWHRRLLARTLGRPQFVVQSFAGLATAGGDQARRLAQQLDDVVHADRGTRARSALRMLTDVRNLSALRELGGAADRITGPISPPRLVLSGWAVGVVLIAVVAAVPVALGSALGLLLR